MEDRNPLLHDRGGVDYKLEKWADKILRDAGVERKTCTECKIAKGFKRFSKNRSMPDGLNNICKPCCRKTKAE